MFIEKRVLFILLFFTQAILFGQITNKNFCDLEFNLNIKKQDSIPLRNESGKIIKYLTQSEFNSITPYITTDSSSTTISRIKSINQVIINYEKHQYKHYTDNQKNTINQFASGFWITNDYLKTDFGSWIYRMNRWSLSKQVNPNGDNFFYIYSKPSTKSKKNLLDINDFFEGKNDIVLYKIEILECKGKWAKIKINLTKKEIIGWMPYYNFCHNILTTCTTPKLTKDSLQNLIEDEE